MDILRSLSACCLNCHSESSTYSISNTNNPTRNLFLGDDHRLLRFKREEIIIHAE